MIPTLKSRASIGVIWDGSTKGMGRHLSNAFETIPCHCGGRPTYLKLQAITNMLLKELLINYTYIKV